MTHDERVRHHLYETLEGITEHAERIASLEELVLDLYCLCYPQQVSWKTSDAVWDKYEPCEICQKEHGGRSPCASTAKDMSDECCIPIQTEIVAERMRSLDLEVPDA